MTLTAEATKATLKREPWFSRKRLFQIHGWLGMSLGGLLFVICFSGAAAVLSREIDWLVNPAVRVAPAGDYKGWNDWLHAAQQAHPDWRPRWINAPPNPYFAVDIVMEAPSGLWRHVYINPYTAELKGGTSYFNVQRFLRDFHRLLNIFVSGLFIVSSFGIVLLFSVVSGLLFYRNFWRNLFQLRLNKGTRALMSDLHRLVGTWSFVFAAIIAVTGIWYLIEYSAVYTGNYTAPKALKIAATKQIAHGPSPQLAAPDQLIAAAQKAFPDLAISSLHFPPTVADPALVYGQSATLLVRDRANTVAINPFDASVMRVQRADQMSVGERLQDTADPLHFGDFGGITSKIIWSLFGMALPAMILTGAYLSIRQARRDEAPQPQWWRIRQWNLWSWAALAIVAASLYYSVPAATRYKTPAIPRYTSLGTHAIGPWKVRVEAGNHTARLHFDCGMESSCEANMKPPTVALANGKPTKMKPWAVYWTAANLATPASYNGILKVLVEDWSGTKFTASIAAPREAFEDSATVIPDEGDFTGIGTWFFLIPFLLVLTAIFVAWMGRFAHWHLPG